MYLLVYSYALNVLPGFCFFPKGLAESYKFYYYLSHGVQFIKVIDTKETNNGNKLFQIEKGSDSPADTTLPGLNLYNDKKAVIKVIPKNAVIFYANENEFAPAAGVLVEKVFNSGFKYDCPANFPGGIAPSGFGGGGTHYTDGLTACELRKWLNYLAGKPFPNHNQEWMNCTDCGTILTGLANIIGCALWSSRMGAGATGYDGFGCHDIIGIGSAGESVMTRVWW